MIKLKTSKIKAISDSSIKTDKKEKSILQNELSLIIKRKKEELNIQIQKIKIQEIVLDKIKMNHKEEISKLKKTNHQITDIEKELESIENNISKVNKRKSYNISSIINLKHLFKSSSQAVLLGNSKKYSFLFKLNGKWGLNDKNNIDDVFLDIITDDEDEFYYYLKNLEKYYINLEKENKEEYHKFKSYINEYLENDNSLYPYDKLLFYLNNIIQGIDLSYILKNKYAELNEIESRKNLIMVKIKKLEFIQLNKENLIKEMKNYTELLKDLIHKYSSYQNKYKNNLISKHFLSKQIKEIQEINLQQWNPENKNIISFKDSNDDVDASNNDINDMNLIKSKINFLNFKNKSTNNSAIFNINLNDNLKLHTSYYESKSMNISRDKSADYFQQIEGPLSKKNSIDKMDTSNEELLLSLSRSNNSNRENVIENNENESPVSRINITTKMKNSSNVYKKKLSIKNIPNSGINFNYLSSSKKENCQGLLYNKKSNSLTNLSENNNIKDYKTSSSTYRKNKETKDSLRYDSITSNSKIVNENEFISPKIVEKVKNLKESNIDKKKGLFFIKKVKKNKKFVIDKKKLFNKNFEKLLKDSIYNRNKKNEVISKSTKKDESSLSQSNYKYYGGDNNRININMSKIPGIIGYKDKYDKFSQENTTNTNSKQNDDIKTIYYDAYYKKCNDSIKTIKDEIKKRNYLSINKKAKKNLVIKKNEIGNDLKRDDCCISCT